MERNVKKLKRRRIPLVKVRWNSRQGVEYTWEREDQFKTKKGKQVKADDQAIQTILTGLPEDIYVETDSCNIAKEIWLRVQQMMKGTDIGVHEKEAMLLNELERFTFVEGESIESYYHHFAKLMNDLDGNQPTLKNIAWHNAGNMIRYNARQNAGNLIRKNANGNVIAARAENNRNGNNANQIRCYNCRGVGHYAKNCIKRPRRRDAAYLQTQLLIAQNFSSTSFGSLWELYALEMIMLQQFWVTDVSLCVGSLCIALFSSWMSCEGRAQKHRIFLLDTSFSDLQWGNILIARVYFVEGLGHNLFSVGQFCDSDLEVAFRRNTCYVRNLDGVDLFKGNRSTNLYTINLREMNTSSLIVSWLVLHQPSLGYGINGYPTSILTP
ncbi:retrovirus-related pol polyprotein from transposon TNT 1-94 [Tanacetum coccineum]